MSTAKPIKVAIVGGGCAAMSAAFELTRPENDGRYQVTVYQMGWRLGGKGASGRGPNGRIEEHGLHIWMGWYENAFRMMRDCYGELRRDPAAPLATWREAFSPLTRIGTAERTIDGGWESWSAIFPPMDGLPGDPMPDGPNWSVPHYMARTARLLASLFEAVRTGGAIAPQDQQDSQEASADTLTRLLRYGELATLAGMVQGCSVLSLLLSSKSSPIPHSLIAQVIEAIAANGRELLEQRLQPERGLGHAWHIIDLALAAFRGVLAGGLLTDPRGFDAIDHYDCRQWLREHGASEAALDSGFLRALYDLGFAYEEGDPARPCTSAGQAMRGTLRAFFTYRGSFFWKMHAGMGDVVFAPLFEVLRRRGVRFEFFHTLREVQPADDGDAPHVSRLLFDLQAQTISGGAYEPLVDVKGLPCWPAEPDYDQLRDGAGLRASGVDFESASSGPCVGSRTLELGRDFDFVVLGVGLGAIPTVCKTILEQNAEWRSMVGEVKTAATQAFQIWLHDDMRELGWNDGAVALSGFVEPFDTWADMTHLLPFEAWGEDGPKSLAYFCNVLPEADAAAGPRAAEIVRQNAVRFLQNDVVALWPKIVDEGGRFRWDRLVAPDGGEAADSAGFAMQFWRANVEPTDRYVLSMPGTAKYRISPLDRSYDNLTVAGDWTACGFEAGCVEAAVMSGRLAAHALSGSPTLEDIIGYDHP